MNNDTLFLFLARKKHFLKLCIFSIRSLQRFGKFNILIIVDNEEEKKYLSKYLKEVEIKILSIDIGKLNMWCWKPLLLKKLNIKSKRIIISDVDILWHKNPKNLLSRIGTKTWFHKITSLDPKEILDNLDNPNIPKRRIGLINMIRYCKVAKISTIPNYHVNCGLFSLSNKKYYEISKKWFLAIKKMNHSHIMTEAVLSMVLADSKISPYCDIEDIKHHKTIKHQSVKSEVNRYKFLKKKFDKDQNGYKYATHYHGTMRLQMCIQAKKYNIDHNNFFFSLAFDIYADKIKGILKKLF